MKVYILVFYEIYTMDKKNLGVYSTYGDASLSLTKHRHKFKHSLNNYDIEEHILND